MVDLKKIQFKGYFIHKNDSVTYKLLYIYENDEETTLKNLISIQEEDFAILYKKGNHIFIKTFISGENFKDFYQNNYLILNGKSYIKTPRIYESIISYIEMKEKLNERNRELKKQMIKINRKR